MTELPAIRNLIANFEFITWNVSGIPIELQEHTFAQIYLKANPAIILLQEFDSEYCAHRPPITIVNHRAFSSNGHSGPSRSNAIALHVALLQLFVLFDGCAIANGLILKLRCFWLVCLNLHVPYHGHDMSLEESFEEIEHFLAH